MPGVYPRGRGLGETEELARVPRPREQRRSSRRGDRRGRGRGSPVPGVLVAPEAERGPVESLTLRARKLVSSCSPVGHKLAERLGSNKWMLST